MIGDDVIFIMGNVKIIAQREISPDDIPAAVMINNTD